MTAPTALLTAAYAPLLALSDRLAATDTDTDTDTAESVGWTPTALPGWTVRDLVFHLAGDAQRALVALHTPAAGAVDTDAVSYWSHWAPGTDGATGLRHPAQRRSCGRPTRPWIGSPSGETGRLVTRTGVSSQESSL